MCSKSKKNLMGPMEACRALFEEGKRIRRTHWNMDEWIELRKSDGVIVDQDGLPTVFLQNYRSVNDKNFVVVEREPELTVGDTYRFRRSTFTVKYVDHVRNVYLGVVEKPDDRDAGYDAGRVSDFLLLKDAGDIVDHKRVAGR